MSGTDSTAAEHDVSAEEPSVDASLEDSEAGTAESPPGSQTSSLGDPVIKYLTLAFLGVILLFLVAILSAMVFGFLRPPRAPRTLVEQELSLYGSQVQSGKADAETWGKYIGVLIDAGQLSKARTVLDSALKSAASGKSAILLQQARLEYAEKDYAASVKTCDATLAEAEAEQAALLEDLKTKRINEPPSKALPASWLPAAHQKGDALVQLGKKAEAVEAYTLYLKEAPTDSSILVARGEIKADLGDAKAAASDFREALKYIPDYQPALDGLEDIGSDAK